MESHRILPPSSILILFLALTLVPVTSPFFLEWGPDLEGPWCAKRPRGQDCCVGRDDYCAVPILGTECYCDIFCNETAYDCCPDYWSHCYGSTRAPPRTTILPPPRPTRPPSEFEVACTRQGVQYRPGDRIVDNCNECTCELYTVGRPRYEMRCTDKVCLIRPEFINRINGLRSTWRAGNTSEFWGMSLDDGIKYRLGTYPLESDVLDMTPIKVRQDESLPETFDARDKWPGLLHPIRNQGDCGSSWAFSTTAVASDRLSIESDGAIKDELSAQHMLSCDTDDQDGCTGGHVDRAWFFLRKFGVVTEACYPYDSGRSSMEGECQLPVRQKGGNCPSGVEYKIEKRYKASPPYRIRPIEREIMKEIMDNGPVQAIFEVKEDFFMYKSGVYQWSGITYDHPPAPRKSGYHSVRIMGWGVDRTPEGDIIKYWICANSWGPEWGEKGYFRIVRGVNAVDIEHYIIGAWGKITGDVTLRQVLTESRRLRLRTQVDEDDDTRLRNLRSRRRRHHRGQKKLKSLEPRRRRNRNGSGRLGNRNRKGGKKNKKSKGKKGKKNRKNKKKSGRHSDTTTAAGVTGWEEVLKTL